MNLISQDLEQQKHDQCTFFRHDWLVESVPSLISLPTSMTAFTHPLTHNWLLAILPLLWMVTSNLGNCPPGDSYLSLHPLLLFTLWYPLHPRYWVNQSLKLTWLVVLCSAHACHAGTTYLPWLFRKMILWNHDFQRSFLEIKTPKDKTCVEPLCRLEAF